MFMQLSLYIELQVYAFQTLGKVEMIYAVVAFLGTYKIANLFRKSQAIVSLLEEYEKINIEDEKEESI